MHNKQSVQDQQDLLEIAGRPFVSRLLVGTGK